jgi:hypothetical protein
MRTFLASAVAGLLVLSLATAANAQSTITPGNVTHTMNLGDTFIIDKTITIGEFGATFVDLFFLADNTGSMGPEVNRAKAGVSTILGNLPPGAAYNFGVGRYLGDPGEPGYNEVTAYTRILDLTSDPAAVQAAVDTWFASGGGDLPEANFYALQQMSNTTSWRTGSQRLVVWFGDARSHTMTTTEAEAIAALQNAGVTVIAFNSSGPGTGIDQFGQASNIVAATGGSLTHNFRFGLTDEVFIEAVNSAITTATATLDLVFGSTFAGSGLTLQFFCTDPLGCTNVSGGESRDFQLHITANEVGVYDFEVFARGVDAREFDSITVVDATAVPVPEPVTLSLLAVGLMGIGYVSRRRRQDGINA